jgi:uncharacterized membrane protein required for colicin V production
MESTTFNAVDVGALVILLFGVWRGFRRGLSGELARLISLAVVMLVGWHAHEPLGEIVAGATRLSPEQSRLAAFLVAILAAGLCMFVLRLVLRQIMEFKFKNPLETVGGMVAGFLRSFILVALIVVAAGLTPILYFQRVFAEESLIGSAIVGYVVPVYRQVAEENPELGLPSLDRLDRTGREPSTPDGAAAPDAAPPEDAPAAWDAGTDDAADW